MPDVLIIKIIYSIVILIICMVVYFKINDKKNSTHSEAEDKKNSLAQKIVWSLITAIIGALLIPSGISLIDVIVEVVEFSGDTYGNDDEILHASGNAEASSSSSLASIPEPDNTSEPGNTSEPDNIAAPTNTSRPTATPKPSSTPKPVNTSEPTAPATVSVDMQILPISDVYKSINDIADLLIEVSPMELTYFEGNMTSERQPFEYTFTPPINGRYRFEATDMVSGMEIQIKVLNQAGKKVSGTTYGVTNGYGVTIDNMVAGETYTIQAEQYSGYGTYKILIGEQKSTVSIDNGITQITDSIQYTDQKNIYEFVPPLNGRYRFGVEMASGSEVNMAVYNQGGAKVRSTPYGITNGGGLTIDNMVAGETYSIYIMEYAGNVNYKLQIGYQKETVQINGETKISDSVQYKDQCNQYQFVPAVSGRYRFEISDITSGVSVNMYLLNQGGKRISNTVYGITKGGGLTVDQLTAGEVYTIQVVQYEDLFSPYTLGIGYQKEPVELNVSSVSDTMQYKEQQNIYQFTPQTSGDYSFAINDMTSGMEVKFSAYNEGGGRIGGTAYGISNGYELMISDMVQGETYSIYVIQDEGMGEYTITVKPQ